MPCDQNRLVSIDLDVASIDIFKLGLEADGYTVGDSYGELYITKDGQFIGSYNANTKKLRYQESRYTESELSEETRANMLKRAYARGAIESQAKKYGWNVKQTGERQFQGIKRGF